MPDGTLINKRLFKKLGGESEKIYPDGMTCDSEGHIWVGHWNGSKVVRYNQDTAKPLHEIVLPALNVTSCCFGGPDMQTLFITTASFGTDMEKFPKAGSLFAVPTKFTGVEQKRCKVGINLLE